MPLLKLKNIGIIFFVIISVTTIAESANDSYCFQFTWVGPEFDNDTSSSVENKTCEEMNLSPPCQDPVLFTFDGSPPDTTYLWDNYDRDQIACKLTRNSVCMKWVNYYDGLVENITYWCGKMTGSSGPIRDGCERDSSGVYTSQACACRTPVIGGDPRIPCNGGSHISANILISLFVLTSATLALLKATNPSAT